MKHSKECEMIADQFKKDYDAYIALWPSYCRACGGTGSITFSQSVPYGMGSASFDVTDPCGECVEEGYCPRCHYKYDDPEHPGLLGDAPCPYCGFDQVNGESAPYWDGCCCSYMEEDFPW